MKIVMATHYFDSHRGGVEIVAGHLYREWARLGEEVVWIASASVPPPNTGRSRTVRLPAWNFIEKKIGLPFPVPRLAALKEIDQEIASADVVLIHDCLYLTNIVAFMAAKFRRIPVILVQHTVPNERHVFQLLMRGATSGITRPMLSNAEQVVFVSERTKGFYSNLRLKRSPQIVFNGVDADVFVPLRQNESKKSLRQEFQLPEDRPAILFVGRFVAKKGLRILRKMVSMRPEFQWIFAGWGPLDPNTWGLGNTRVICGLQGHSLARLYRASDILVLPSVNEGFPLVIQEALASGVPVVCAAETIAADPAMNCVVSGVAVDQNDEEITAKKFLVGIDQVLARNSSGEQSPAMRSGFAASRYSWRAAAAQYLSIASIFIANHAPRDEELRLDKALK